MNNMDLNYAIKLCRSIGECEVGTIKKQAINRVIDEIIQINDKNIAYVDNDDKK